MRIGRRSPLALFANANFVRVWLIGGLANSVRWLELLAAGIFVYEVSGSAFLVALITLSRQLPLALFAPFVGAWADRGDRKLMLMAAMALTAASSLTMAVLAATGRIEVWHLCVAGFVSGAAWTTDFSVRRTLVGEFAGRRRLGQGVSFDSATNNATRMLGPLAGGLIYQFVGLDGAYWVAGFTCLVNVAIGAGIRTRPRAGPGRAERYLATLKQGLGMLRGNREFVGILCITVILNIFGFPYAAMVPVLGRARFAVEPALIGLLSAAEGLGAFLGALAIAFLARPDWFKRIYLYGAAGFMAGVLALSLTPSYALAVAVMLAAGFAVAGFAAMQATLVLLAAPPEARSRMMSLLSVCIGMSPIGLLHVGLLAEYLPPHLALTVIAVEGLLAIAVTAWLIPALRR